MSWGMGCTAVYGDVCGGRGGPLHQMMVVYDTLDKWARRMGNMGTATTDENDPGASIAIAVIFYFK